MQYMDTMALTMIVLASLSIFFLISSSVPNKMRVSLCSSMWFPYSIGLYFYNKLVDIENGIVENVIYGVGVFSALYIIFSLGLFYKNNKTKVQ